MTPAAVIVLLVALLLVVATWLLFETRGRERAEVIANRRLELIGELRAEVRSLKADRDDQRRPIAPVRMSHPHPPLAHRADPAATQIMPKQKRGAA